MLEDLENIDIDKVLEEGEQKAEEKVRFLEEKLKKFSEGAT